MPISSSELKLYLSGGAANSDPNAALGGAVSSVEIVDATIHNLFDKVNASEGDAGDTEYRAFYVKNTHGALTLSNAYIYIETNSPSPDSAITISVATETGSPIQTIANENTAPSTQTFVTADGFANQLSLGNLAAGAVKGVWIKRVISASADAYSSDNVVIAIGGETV